MIRPLLVLALVAAPSLVAPSSVTAATVRETMEDLTHELSRTLRKLDVEAVHLPAVAGPAGSFVRDEFIRALAESGIETTDAADVTLTLACESSAAGPGERPYVFSIKITGADVPAREIRRAVVLDLADRIVLEAATYDATTTGEGTPRVATHKAIRAALGESGLVVEPGAFDEDPGDRGDETSGVSGRGTSVNVTGDVRVTVDESGRVTIETGGTRIVVERDGRMRTPNDAAGAADRSGRRPRTERRTPAPQRRDSQRGAARRGDSIRRDANDRASRQRLLPEWPSRFDPRRVPERLYPHFPSSPWRPRGFQPSYRPPGWPNRHAPSDRGPSHSSRRSDWQHR